MILSITLINVGMIFRFSTGLSEYKIEMFYMVALIITSCYGHYRSIGYIMGLCADSENLLKRKSYHSHPEAGYVCDNVQIGYLQSDT